MHGAKRAEVMRSMEKVTYKVDPYLYASNIVRMIE
jgi:hypothetical protein